MLQERPRGRGPTTRGACRGTTSREFAIPELYQSPGHESFSKFDGWTYVFLGGTLNIIIKSA